jgi:Fe-S cluster biogenesis protein NfuA
MKIAIRFGAVFAMAALLAGCLGGSLGSASVTPAGQTPAPAPAPAPAPTPTPPPTTVLDTVVVTIGGLGTVSSNPTGINCGGSSGCSQSFPVGTSVTLTAAPSAGETFVGWTGACSGTAPTCVITVNTTENVGASFAPVVQTDSLHVTVGGSGTVTSNPSGITCSGGSTGCSQTFVNGTSVTLTEAPASGYKFSGWSGSCSGSASSCTVTLGSASQSVGATFAIAVQYFALQVASNGNGTVTSTPAGINCNGSTGCSQSFTSGTAVTLTATPASGYVFSSWSGACSGTATTCAVTLTSALSVGATFAASPPPPTTARYLVSNPYPLTVAQPNHFVVSCDGGAPVTSVPAVNPDGTSYLDFNLSGLSAGAHTCSVAAADASNNQSAAVTVSFTL